MGRNHRYEGGNRGGGGVFGPEVLDISIIGDEEEQDRIQLENNLQDISIQLSVTNPSQASDHEREPFCDGHSMSLEYKSLQSIRQGHRRHPSEQPHFIDQQRQQQYHADYTDHERETDEDQLSGEDTSVEYPRHNPHPRDHDMSIMHGQSSQADSFSTHGYVIHQHGTVDDYEDGGLSLGAMGIMNTVSSAGHHASDLTLKTGLAGRYARNQADVSLSGAEYDPERPLDNVMRGLANDLSMLNMASARQTKPKPKSRTKRTPSGAAQVTFNSLVYDETGDLDRLRGSFSSHSLPVSDINGGLPATNSHLQSEPTSNHPKLSDAFSHLSGALSPRRPRTVTPSRDQTPTNRSIRSSRRQPEVLVQPPTPPSLAISDSSSKFARMARELATEIEQSQRSVAAASSQNDSRILAQSTTKATKKKQVDRNPFQDIVNHPPILHVDPVPPPSKKTKKSTQSERTKSDISRATRTPDNRSTKQIHLPDVTGLTSVVTSPARASLDWKMYSGTGSEDKSVQKHLYQTLTSLQSRLTQLESQNLISRRRVRELELELEACKAEVRRERTRVLEREEIIVAQQKEAEAYKHAKTKVDASNVSTQSRYHEVVEEKKALEALISTLRSHLTRLTTELSSQQALLAELRALRESDNDTVKAKMDEVDRLKNEVERLGNEVEVLRGVVEEGLKERRKAKETRDQSVNTSLQMLQSIALNEPEISNDRDDHESFDDNLSRASTPTPSSRSQSRLQNITQVMDRTMRTDRATNGTGPTNADNLTVDPVIEEEELDQVSADMEPSRLERSVDEVSLASSDISLPTRRRRKQPTVLDEEQDDDAHTANLRPPTNRNLRDTSSYSQQPSRSVRVNSPPARAGPSDLSRREVDATPFPQIRGERLERLFFSAPEHNARTCAVCHRRRRPGSPSLDQSLPTFVHARRRTSGGPPPRNDDEGFVDAEDADLSRPGPDSRRAEGGVPGDDGRLPPQTVLARVVRELEDDFSHYKQIYIELADQYRVIDAVSNVAKRNVLAEHLTEVIGILEQKGDQIANLYELLEFKDRPYPDRPQAGQQTKRHNSSPPAVVLNGASWGRMQALRKHSTLA